MAEFEIPPHGAICWRELASNDLPRAIEFYSKLFDWQLPQTKITNIEYKEIVLDNTAVGGMMAIDENWGPTPPPSHWTTYIAVSDVEETAKRIEEEGGSVKVPSFEAPGVGRMAMVADPSGAAFSIIQFVEEAASE